MTAREASRVSSGILTDHPNWKPGEQHIYEYGQYSYRVRVNAPGEYHFHGRRKLK